MPHSSPITNFMFRLTEEEAAGLRSQNATSKGRRGEHRYPPSVFTEHGAIMAANLANSSPANRGDARGSQRG